MLHGATNSAAQMKADQQQPYPSQQDALWFRNDDQVQFVRSGAGLAGVDGRRQQRLQLNQRQTGVQHIAQISVLLAV